jgi:uncharacterized protein
MKIIIQDIPKEGLDVTLEVTIEYDAVSSPVSARLKIEKLGAEIIVKGDLTVGIKLQCSRCLKDFYKTVSVPVDAVYHPIEELKDENGREVKNEELDLDFYSGDELDLSDLLKEQIVLNTPMKPLCNELCKGICPGCGVDLNSGNCVCSVINSDTRFEGLKKLLQ